MSNNEKLSILVNSCDKYKDVWDLLFESFRINWSSCPYKIYINTETENYTYKDMPIKVIHTAGKLGLKRNWGGRLKKALKNIDTPYVLNYLDDFVLSEPIQNEEILEKIIDFMDENPEVAVVYLGSFPKWCFIIEEADNLKGFGIMPQCAAYKLSTFPAIWRRNALYRVTKDFETPWQWEMIGSYRASINYYGKFYACFENPDAEEMISKYFKFPWGGALWRGKWNPEALELAKEYGVNIDTTNRGIFEDKSEFLESSTHNVTIIDKLAHKWLLFRELIL
ncbi:hypothetical protein [Butyrivibrio fibrisolvens]|nr:hypothetical protein [Butyrivibrio fibrisolvens]